MPSIVEKSVFEYGGKTLVTLTADFSTLCVANKNGLAKLLRVDKPEEEPEILETARNLSSVKCDPNGRYLITTMKGDAFWLDPRTSTDRLLARSALPLRDCCSIHSGKIAVLGGDDLELILVDLEEVNLRKSSMKVDEQIYQMSYTPKTNLLSISFVNGKIQFFSVSSTRPHKVHELTGYIATNSYKSVQDGDPTEESSNSRNLSGDVDSLEDSEQSITDPEFCVENRICNRVAWHPSGLQFALPCADFTIKIFNVKGYSLMKTLKDSILSVTQFVDLQFDPLVGNHIASVDLKDNLVVWNWRTSEIVYRKCFRHKVTGFVWKPQADGKTLDIILGTWAGDIINVKGIVESISLTSNEAGTSPKDQQSKHNALFVDSDLDDSEIDAASANKPNPDALVDNSDSENIFTQDASDKRRYPFENDDGFIDDDDGAGYVSHKRNRQERPKAQSTHQTLNSHPASQSLRYRPMSQGATPFGSGGRRYMTMNNIGYVSVVRSNEQNSITVSFFDIGRFREYHFEDVFGYDLCSLNENGTLLAQSKSGLLHYRSHNMVHSTWTKTIPLMEGEKITSIAATAHRIFIGTSMGYMRIFNQHGLPLAVEKVSPVVALAAQDYKVFAIHYSPFHGISYSLFEQSPTFSKYYQRECPLPLTLPQSASSSGIEVDKDFIKFNPVGLKSLFFSAYGDPCIFGSDNVLLILSKWRSPSESRWLPVLDAGMELWKMSGGKDDTQVHVWPLGLNYDTLNCILVKGKKVWPEFPLPLPSEMEMRIPLLVKSRILEEDEKRKSKSDGLVGHENSDDVTGEGKENAEIVIPAAMAAEEELLRSKVLSTLLQDAVDNDGEIFGNENEILDSLNWAYDKALLRLFAAASAEQNMGMAKSLVKEIKQDKALLAASKIAERAELPALVKQVNEVREARFEAQINNQ